MAAIGDLVATLTADNSVFVRAFHAAADVATSTASVIGKAVVSITSDLYQVAHGAILTVGQEMAEMALRTAIAGAAVTATGSYFLGFWNTMRVGLTAASWFVPWLKVATISLSAVTLATHAYRAADEYLNGELTKSIVQVTHINDAWAQFKKSLDNTGQSLAIVGDGLGSVGAQAAQAAVDVTGVSTAMEYVDRVAGDTISGLTLKLNATNAGFRRAVDGATDWASAAGASAAELRKLGSATDELIAKQTAQSSIFGQLRAMQDEAAAKASHNADMARVATLASIDAINAEVTALQNKTAALIAAGKATEQSQKNAGAMFAALENHRNADESGTMEKPKQASAADGAIRSASEALDVLVMGRDRAAVAALRAAGATDAEVKQLQQYQQMIAGITAAQDAKKAADDKAAEAAKAQEQLTARGKDQIANMQDQVDLLTGAATKAEIAMRQMVREGFSGEQAAEVGALTDEIEKLEEAKRNEKGKDKSTGGRTEIAAAFKGSQEAASILLRGIGGKSMEQIAQKQLTTQQQTLVAIKSITIPPLIPITLGT